MRTVNSGDISYTISGNRIVLVRDAALSSFLGEFPITVSADHLNITFDSAADTVSGSFFGLVVTGTRV